MLEQLQMMLYPVIIPMVVAFVVLGVVWGVKRVSSERAWLSDWVFGLLLGGAAMAGHLPDSFEASFPPGKSGEWILLIAGVVVVLSLPAAFARRRETPLFDVFALLFGALLAAAPAIAREYGAVTAGEGESAPAFRPMFFEMSASDHALLGALVVIGWFICARLGDRRPGPLVPFALWISFLGCAIVALTAASWITVGFICLSLAGVSFAAGVVSSFLTKDHPRSIGGGGAFAVSTLLVVICFAMYFHGEHGDALRWWHLALIAGAPLSLLLFENRLVETLPNWARATVRFGAVVVLVALGTWSAYAATNTSSDAGGGSDAGDYSGLGGYGGGDESGGLGGYGGDDESSGLGGYDG